jgi:regulator of sigma D
MSDSKFSIEQEETSVRQLVAELQDERSQVWSLYCQIAELKPIFSSTEIRPILSNFLQLLIDYVSLGHFGVYEYLLTSPCQASRLAYAEKLYPAFSSTTASAISFNERYDNGNRKFRVDNLARDLSALGENLAQRMELEDRLCSMLLH